jgi:Na+-driven multidrug efflux pump
VFVAVLALFGTRWVLSVLGEEDFGLYAVVGGLIVFVMFIGNTMTSSVQRFYAYAVGQGDSEEVKKWFNCAFFLHIGFCVVLAIVGIPVGNYLLDNIMQIPLERMAASHWIYYLSIVGGIGTTLTVPFLAMFYAKQRIFELSFWGTLQGILMFSLAWLLPKSSGDILLYYAIGMVGIKLALDVIQVIRAVVVFPECRLCFKYWTEKEKPLVLLSYSGWILFGAGGTMLRNQGLAFLINIYSGARVNAAYGIANQVANQTGAISTAIYQAISPEITSREGAGQRDRMISLSLRLSKLAILLTFFWLIPLYFEMDFVLSIWLKEVPAFAASFCKLILLAYVVDKFTIGYMSAVHANGKIGGYQMMLGSFLALTFPLAWLIFHYGGTPEQAVSIIILTSIACSLARIWWIKKLINIPESIWVKTVFIKCCNVLIPTILLIVFFNKTLNSSYFRLMMTLFLTILTVSTLSWKFSLDSDEKKFIVLKIKKILF